MLLRNRSEALHGLPFFKLLKWIVVVDLLFNSVLPIVKVADSNQTKNYFNFTNELESRQSHVTDI